MSEPGDRSRPPADPRLKLGRVAPLSPERSLRVELGAALVFGVLLAIVGLYLWRRPHVPSGDAAGEVETSSARLPAEDAGAPAVAAVDAGRPSPVVLSGARVLACHDRGPKKTPADQCDHLAPVEKALASAVEQSASCAASASVAGARAGGGEDTVGGVAGSAGAGTIEYVADVSFARHKVSVVLPRAGRSVHDRRILAACASAVRGAMGTLPLDGVDHQHARYRISVTATYGPR